MEERGTFVTNNQPPDPTVSRLFYPCYEKSGLQAPLFSESSGQKWKRLSMRLWRIKPQSLTVSVTSYGFWRTVINAFRTKAIAIPEMIMIRVPTEDDQ